MLRRWVNRRAARHSGWKCLLVGALVVLGATAAVAQTSRYNTDRFVASTRNECADAPGCVTFQQATIGVPPGRLASARFACPATHPNVTVVDWEVLSATCEGRCFYDDGIHLTQSGQNLYADVIGKVLAQP